jgi:hypothetical protein
VIAPSLSPAAAAALSKILGANADQRHRPRWCPAISHYPNRDVASRSVDNALEKRRSLG